MAFYCLCRCFLAGSFFVLRTSMGYAGCSPPMACFYVRVITNRRIALAGAACYMLCGISVSNAQHLFIITSLAWIPFALYFFLKTTSSLAFSDVLKLSLATCLMVTGGYPFLTVVCLYFLLFLFL